MYLHSIKENLTAESLADRPRVPVYKLSGCSGQDLSDAKADSLLKLGLTPGSAAECSFSIKSDDDFHNGNATNCGRGGSLNLQASQK